MRLYWTLEKLQQAANLCKTRGEFATEHADAYYAAHKRGLIDTIFELHENKGFKFKPSGYWTLERIQEIANKYKTRGEMSSEEPTAYDAALRLMVLDQIFSNHDNNGFVTKPRGFWTLDQLKIEAKKYSTRREMYKKYTKAYQQAEKQGFLDEIFSQHENEGRLYHKRKHWTEDRLIDEAAKYKTRGEMAKKSSAGYDAATRSHLLDQIFCDHENNGYEMTGHYYKRAIYRIFTETAKVIYIGLSCNPNDRYTSHTNSNRTAKHLKELIASDHSFEVVSGFLPAHEAQTEEIRLIDEYKADGWIVLNQAKGGGLGSSRKASIYFATKMKAEIEAMIDDQLTDAAIAKQLNENGSRTINGARWTRKTVAKVRSYWENADTNH